MTRSDLIKLLSQYPENGAVVIGKIMAEINDKNDEAIKWVNASLEHYEALHKSNSMLPYELGSFDAFKIFKEKLTKL